MIKVANKSGSKILAQMALNIWDNNSIDELTKEFDSMIYDSNSICFINYEDNLPVGFANASLRYDYVEGCETSPAGYLEGIYVIDDYRNKNIARKLVEACQVWAKDRGCLEFASDCELTNLDSLDFHLAIGFNEVNRIICFKKNI